MNLFGAFPLGLALIFSGSFAAASTWVEGSNPKVLTQKATVLKSVVKIRMFGGAEDGICSSALIGQNLLLTAKHCVNTGFQLLYVNEIPVPSQEVMLSPNTDLALVRFAPTPETTRAFKEVAPLEVSFQGNTGYQNEVLIAGYGISSGEGGDAGTLRAGMNYVAETKEELYGRLKVLSEKLGGSEIPLTSQYLHIIGKREEKQFYQINPGENVVGHSIYLVRPSPIAESTAVPLAGDSGAPLIAFNAAGNPIVIGVAAKAAPDADGILTNLTISRSGSVTSPLSRKMELWESWALFMDAKYIDLDGNAQVSFAYSYDYERIAAATYESTDFAKNAEFIRAQLK